MPHVKTDVFWILSGAEKVILQPQATFQCPGHSAFGGGAKGHGTLLEWWKEHGHVRFTRAYHQQNSDV